MTTMICIAGFGDNGSMYHPLLTTALAGRLDIVALDLPGFGKPAGQTVTTLNSLADVVDAEARNRGAEVVLAHSVASLIASIAASKPNSPIRIIVSLEGNLTEEDAYFSGTAADFDDADSFYDAFLKRLDVLATEEPIIARYRSEVAKADPVALWELGRDARRYSMEHVPGDNLIKSTDVVYVYNPANLPKTSLEWLDSNEVRQVQLDNASHWVSIDQPDRLAEVLTAELTQRGYLT